MSVLAAYSRAASEVVSKGFDTLPVKTVESERRMAAYWDDVFERLAPVHADRSADADAEAYAKKV